MKPLQCHPHPLSARVITEAQLEEGLNVQESVLEEWCTPYSEKRGRDQS
ncbi:hypothetical protein [Brevibacillus sp. SYP-B805]|nr:hypothetical protein [Brevibacillus sp. SYP-B805]